MHVRARKSRLFGQTATCHLPLYKHTVFHRKHVPGTEQLTTKVPDAVISAISPYWQDATTVPGVPGWQDNIQRRGGIVLLKWSWKTRPPNSFVRIRIQAHVVDAVEMRIQSILSIHHRTVLSKQAKKKKWKRTGSSRGDQEYGHRRIGAMGTQRRPDREGRESTEEGSIWVQKSKHYSLTRVN